MRYQNSGFRSRLDILEDGIHKAASLKACIFIA
jgi:hypothetical protein